MNPSFPSGNKDKGSTTSRRGLFLKKNYLLSRLTFSCTARNRDERWQCEKRCAGRSRSLTLPPVKAGVSNYASSRCWQVGNPFIPLSLRTRNYYESTTPGKKRVIFLRIKDSYLADTRHRVVRSFLFTSVGFLYFFRRK